MPGDAACGTGKSRKKPKVTPAAMIPYQAVSRMESWRTKPEEARVYCLGAAVGGLAPAEASIVMSAAPPSRPDSWPSQHPLRCYQAASQRDPTTVIGRC